MTMHDLLTIGLITDEDKITILRPLLTAADIRKGHWYNDHILAFHNKEIADLSWNEEKGFFIKVKG